MISALLAVVGLVLGGQAAKQEWGWSAVVGLVIGGVAVTLIVPFGGLVTFAGCSYLYKVVQNRKLDRIANQVEAEWRIQQGAAPPQIAPQPLSDNPFEPPKTDA